MKTDIFQGIRHCFYEIDYSILVIKIAGMTRFRLASA
jgi:hypothetical protein